MIRSESLTSSGLTKSVITSKNMQGFKNRVEKELKIVTKNKSDPREKFPIQVQRRPLMLGDEIDKKVQLYIKWESVEVLFQK